MTRYYSTLRPLDLGTFPRPAGNRVLNIVNFDMRQYCPEIGREAWGYIEYKEALSEKDAYNYDLMEGGTDNG